MHNSARLSLPLQCIDSNPPQCSVMHYNATVRTSCFIALLKMHQHYEDRKYVSKQTKSQAPIIVTPIAHLKQISCIEYLITTRVLDFVSLQMYHLQIVAKGIFCMLF